LKFITDEQLEWLCKKYSLVYAPVGNYTGNVPDKNLEEIAMYEKISSLDLRPNIFHYEMDDIDYGHFSLDSEIEMDIWELKKHCKKYGYDWIKTHSVFRTIKEDYKTL
jgi:hypothetical protein